MVAQFVPSVASPSPITSEWYPELAKEGFLLPPWLAVLFAVAVLLDVTKRWSLKSQAVPMFDFRPINASIILRQRSCDNDSKRRRSF